MIEQNFERTQWKSKHTPGFQGDAYSPRESWGVLTAREQQILTLLGHGKTSKEIAAILNLSVTTIGSHRRSLCRKLQAHSTAELVHRAGSIIAAVSAEYYSTKGIVFSPLLAYK
jgi:DNA-binding NarL/FixJ family response regulator